MITFQPKFTKILVEKCCSLHCTVVTRNICSYERFMIATHCRHSKLSFDIKNTSNHGEYLQKKRLNANCPQTKCLEAKCPRKAKFHMVQKLCEVKHGFTKPYKKSPHLV